MSVRRSIFESILKLIIATIASWAVITYGGRTHPGPIFTFGDVLGFLVLLLGAVLVARSCGVFPLFFIYGCLGSLPFILIFMEDRTRTFHYTRASTADDWSVMGIVFLMITGSGIACRVAAMLAFDYWGPTYPDLACCKTCGYNLTGNVSGVCPECGKAIERSEHHDKPAEDRLE